MNKHKDWIAYLLPPCILSFITAIFYYPSLRYPFMFDDLPRIMNNYEIRATSVKKLFFLNTRWISTLINHLTFNRWRLNVSAYRIINLGIHILCGILVFYLILLLLKKWNDSTYGSKHSLLIATLTSGLFLLHPVQTQTATYITQMRVEGLCALFALTTILLFSLASYTDGIGKYFLYLLCFPMVIFGIGTKEIFVVVPLLLMLVDWFFLAEGDYRVFLKRLPLHALIGIALYYTYFKLGAPIKPAEAFTLQTKIFNNRGGMIMEKPEKFIPPMGYLIGQFRVIVHYITMFFWPFGLSFDYGWKIPQSFWSPTCLFSLFIILNILLAGLALFIKNLTNIFSFCIAWFFIVVLPRSTIIPSTEFVCDYKTYLASIGPLLLIAIGFTWVVEKIFVWAKQNAQLNSFRPMLRPIFVLFLCVTLGVSTMERNKVWTCRRALWEDVINKTRGHVSPRAYNNYAIGLVDEGKNDEAIQYFLKALERDPEYAEPITNLALQYQNNKEDKKALSFYQRAIKLNIARPEMFNNLGLLHLTRKTYDKAEASFKQAIKLKRHYSKAHFNLGQTYQVQGKYKEARDSYGRAIAGDNQLLNFYYRHGLMSYKLKDYGEAKKTLAYVASKNKNFMGTMFMLANCYYFSREYDKANPLFAAVYEKKWNDSTHGKSASVAYNYAQNLLHLEQYEKALPLFMRCRGQKGLPHTQLHIAKCLHHVGKTEAAKKELAHFMKSAPTLSLKQMGVQLLKEISTA